MFYYTHIFFKIHTFKAEGTRNKSNTVTNPINKNTNDLFLQITMKYLVAHKATEESFCKPLESDAISR